MSRNRNARFRQELSIIDQTLDSVTRLTTLPMRSGIELLDGETGCHHQRTQHYVRLLAQQLREQGRFIGFFSEVAIKLLCRSAALHDIGKAGGMPFCASRGHLRQRSST